VLLVHWILITCTWHAHHLPCYVLLLKVISIISITQISGRILVETVQWDPSIMMLPSSRCGCLYSYSNISFRNYGYTYLLSINKEKYNAIFSLNYIIIANLVVRVLKKVCTKIALLKWNHIRQVFSFLLYFVASAFGIICNCKIWLVGHIFQLKNNQMYICNAVSLSTRNC